MLEDPNLLPEKLAEFFLNQMQRTPVERVAQVLLGVDQGEIATSIMDAYDQFLGLLASEEKRTHLEDLKFDEVGNDSLFQEVRSMSQGFQRGLTRLCFESQGVLREMVIKYGVF